MLSLRERLWKTWFPPAAVVGGIATLIAAALRVRPEPQPTPPAPTRGAGGRVTLPVIQTQPSTPLDWQYAPSGMIGGTLTAPPFKTSLLDVAIGLSDQVCALGDGEIHVFGADGGRVRRWPAPAKAECLTVAPDGRVYVAGAGRVDIFDQAGARAGGFVVSDAGPSASLTAIRVVGPHTLVADASARIIWRVDANGRTLNRIGDRNKTKAFILPNGRLDFAVDAAGIVRATDTGRHQVTAWDLDGTPAGAFGTFGMSDPADFVGCCNPVNLALTPDGMVVTAEKMVARVKVFEPGGRLLAVIGPEHFDRMCTQIHLAVDSQGRIVAGDPVRRTIMVFSRVSRKAPSHG